MPRCTLVATLVSNTMTTLEAAKTLTRWTDWSSFFHIISICTMTFKGMSTGHTWQYTFSLISIKWISNRLSAKKNLNHYNIFILTPATSDDLSLSQNSKSKIGLVSEELEYGKFSSLGILYKLQLFLNSSSSNSTVSLQLTSFTISVF